MWTDTYKPRKFTELLGDDRVHRSAMAWLKEWDACVFKPTSGAGIAAARKKALVRKRARDGPKGAAAAGGAEGADAAATDPFGRPQEKILLLCGPPGLGKTTLAHVLASQAGYSVAEINASDDRMAKVVTDRIRDCLETRSIAMDGSISGNRPTCVVIDEIDGASGGEAGVRVAGSSITLIDRRASCVRWSSWSRTAAWSRSRADGARSRKRDRSSDRSSASATTCAPAITL